MPSQQDSPWKDIIEKYFRLFMAFFLPQAHADINWRRKIEFLDKELPKLGPKNDSRNRLADKLVKVFRKDGTEIWVLIHIEVQGYYDANFEERAYVYNYRIFDRYDHKVVTMTVLTDDNSDYRPDSYKFELWGFKHSMNFIFIKLMDYADKWQELERNPNPFALVVMAQLKLLELKGKPELGVWKFTLVRMAFERGYTREMIRDLYQFIDWQIRLPLALERKFDEDVSHLQEETNMPYVSRIERRGQHNASYSITLRQLEYKFGPLEAGLKEQLHALNSEQLEELSVALLNFKQPGDLLDWLQANPPIEVEEPDYYSIAYHSSVE